jgi:hypothetical protein
MSELPPQLAHLPEPVRQKLEQVLARLPPPMRQQVLGSPMLKKMIEHAERELRSAGQSAQSVAGQVRSGSAIETARSAAQRLQQIRPHGHYNATIQPGDRVSLRGCAILLALLVGVVGLISLF